MSRVLKGEANPIGEVGITRVLMSPITGDLYVIFVLPDNGKFKRGDKVKVAALLESSWRERGEKRRG